MEVLPSKEKTFAFEHIGEATGKKYDGQFTVLCLLSVGQKYAMSLEKTRLMGNYPNPTDDLAGFAVILANLRSKIVSGPEWWNQSNGGSTIDDEDTLVTLYRKILEAEIEWKEDLKKKTQKIPDPHISIVDSIKKLAAFNARAELHTEEQLLLFLQSWWSRTYNRPLKDPLLLSYTLEELLYEFYDRIERIKAEEERLESEDVKIEEEKDKLNEDWAEKMEREELEADMRKSGAESSKTTDPTKDPANVAWMEKQIEAGKEVYGETFGEDIDENFDG